MPHALTDMYEPSAEHTRPAPRGRSVAALVAGLAFIAELAWRLACQPGWSGPCRIPVWHNEPARLMIEAGQTGTVRAEDDDRAGSLVEGGQVLAAW